VLRRIAGAGLPIVVTENGIATDDTQRVRYLRSHLAEVKSALDAGIDARGYRPTFGLVARERLDGRRMAIAQLTAS
jgi:beta-glucosidase